MARLLVHVEGQTEETFVNEVLRIHLVARGYDSVSARLVGNARLRQGRGGIRSWPTVRTGILNHLRDDQDCIATTMIDYYGLPNHGPGAWPGRARSAGLRSTEEKARFVQEAVRNDLATGLGARFNSGRFVPFVVMHEFEGLLFSDCAAFSHSIGRSDLEIAFRKIREQFATPEDINDSADTAPSKRVQALAERYQKPLNGVRAVLEIGLSRIQEECPHFDNWLTHLEILAR